ncbi:MAG: hypothetical protein AAF449_11365 [Myxococcota bacterium]
MQFKLLFAVGAVLLGLSWASPAEAKKYKNLKVLADNGKALKKGMKKMTRGLGVKCKACHIKGKWDKDDVQAKVKSREFFEAVVGSEDAAAKEAALKALLKVLELEKAKKPDMLWEGMALLEKKK